jgi:crossover junction endodeoxyribonuclease RusA
MIEIKLPYPPSVNHYKRAGRITTTANGKIYQKRVNSDATNRFFYEVWVEISRMRSQEGLKSFGDATISVEIDAYPPDKRKRDLDNILKVLLDSLQKTSVYKDDNQIARLLVTRCPTIAQGQIIVRIKHHVP